MRRVRGCWRGVLALAVVVPAVAGATTGARANVRGGLSSPRAAAGPGTVVFFSYRDPAGSFYTESGAGGPLRLLLAGTNRAGDIAGALYDDGVVWAPDGKHFLYLLLAPPGQTQDQLWSSDLTGKTRVLLARGAQWPPSWSPDGRRIAFPTNGDGIWVAGANGRGARPRTSGLLDEQPRWSPDGHSIAFIGPGTGGCGRDLLAVRPSGGAPHRLAQRVASGASWSPNGKQIAYEGFASCLSAPGSDYPTGLYISDRRGRHARLIDSCADGAPAWSPDGKWIVVARGPCAASADTSGTWIEHPNGRDRRRLTTMVPWTVDVDHLVAPVWAPDSRRLAVAAGDRTDIWVLGLNGANRQLTEGTQYGYNSYGPSWQPRNLPPQRLGGSIVSPAIPTDTILVPASCRSGAGGEMSARCSSGSRRASRTASRSSTR